MFEFETCEVFKIRSLDIIVGMTGFKYKRNEEIELYGQTLLIGFHLFYRFN